MAKKTVSADSKMSDTILAGEPADIFVRLGNTLINPEHQMLKTHSAVYGCDEFVWRGKFEKGKKIRFTHGNNASLPDPMVYNQISGPGMTFSGPEACLDFIYKKALVCPVEGVDLIYNFIDAESELYYEGKTGVHTLYMRIYDNNSGIDNDRWLVVSLE